MNAITICNLALSRLGDAAGISSISPPDGSAQAAHCARFYPLAVATLLSRHAFAFAVREQALALLGQQDGVFGYALPQDCLRLLGVLPETGDKALAFELAGAHIRCRAAGARARFIYLEDDPTRFPPLFVDALGWLLAAHLAGALYKGEAGAAQARNCLQVFEAVLDRAMTSDANQQRLVLEHLAPWIAARR